MEVTTPSMLALMALMLIGATQSAPTPLNCRATRPRNVAVRLGQRILLRCGNCEANGTATAATDGLMWRHRKSVREQFEYAEALHREDGSDKYRARVHSGVAQLESKGSTDYSFAGVFSCFNFSTKQDTAAEVIMIETNPECVGIMSSGHVLMNDTIRETRDIRFYCEIQFNGNWAPTLQLQHQHPDGQPIRTCQVGARKLRNGGTYPYLLSCEATMRYYVDDMPANARQYQCKMYFSRDNAPNEEDRQPDAGDFTVYDQRVPTYTRICRTTAREGAKTPDYWRSSDENEKMVRLLPTYGDNGPMVVEDEDEDVHMDRLLFQERQAVQLRRDYEEFQQDYEEQQDYKRELAQTLCNPVRPRNTAVQTGDHFVLGCGDCDADDEPTSQQLLWRYRPLSDSLTNRFMYINGLSTGTPEEDTEDTKDKYLMHTRSGLTLLQSEATDTSFAGVYSCFNFSAKRDTAAELIIMRPGPNCTAHITNTTAYTAMRATLQIRLGCEISFNGGQSPRLRWKHLGTTIRTCRLSAQNLATGMAQARAVWHAWQYGQYPAAYRLRCETTVTVREVLRTSIQMSHTWNGALPDLRAYECEVYFSGRDAPKDRHHVDSRVVYDQRVPTYRRSCFVAEEPTTEEPTGNADEANLSSMLEHNAPEDRDNEDAVIQEGDAEDVRATKRLVEKEHQMQRWEEEQQEERDRRQHQEKEQEMQRQRETAERKEQMRRWRAIWRTKDKQKNHTPFIDIPRDTVAVAGSVAHLDCRINLTLVERPNIAWFHKPSPSEGYRYVYIGGYVFGYATYSAIKYKVNGTFGDYSLTINDVNETDVGMYLCVDESEINNDAFHARLTVVKEVNFAAKMVLPMRVDVEAHFEYLAYPPHDNPGMLHEIGEFERPVNLRGNWSMKTSFHNGTGTDNQDVMIFVNETKTVFPAENCDWHKMNARIKGHLAACRQQIHRVVSRVQIYLAAPVPWATMPPASTTTIAFQLYDPNGPVAKRVYTALACERRNGTLHWSHSIVQPP